MPPSPCSRRPSFSLVEVVASLFLVGTILVAVLVAHNRAAGQTRSAQRRLSAIAALDGFLKARLQPDADHLQLPTGKLPGENPYNWRSALRYDPALDQLDAAILRIELYDPTFKDGQTLADVELLAPGGGRP